MPRYLIEYWIKSRNGEDFDEVWETAETEEEAHKKVKDADGLRTNLQTKKTEP